MDEIKYIGFYDLPGAKYKRVSTLAATNKMDYICDAINRAGFKIHLISPSWYDDNSSAAKYECKKTIEINNFKRITFCPSYGTRNKWSRNFKIILTLLWLFFWLMLNVRKNEKILVYHVQWLSLPLRLAKFFIGFKLILEVEEFYGDVFSLHPYFDKIERKLIKSADFYFFSTELLANRFSEGKKYIIIYGIYKVFPKLSTHELVNKIHLLYSGVIDFKKAGVINAINSAKYLSSNYDLNIIGFGESDLILETIANHNKENQCKIFFDGIKTGDDFVKYCQNCQIGLSTQKMDGKYLETSFPSKILSYLSLGLRVVSCRIKCVEISKINDLMTYYDEDSPFAIAEAIKKVNINESYNPSIKIIELDQQFIVEIKKLLLNE